MLIDISWLKYMSSGDSILAILIGLLGAFLLRILSRLMEASTPFNVRRLRLGTKVELVFEDYNNKLTHVYPLPL
jgi:hypothetical protein